jgi:glycosyltransferase involved in cell wall biosynthesis
MLAIIIPFFKLTFFEATLQSLSNQTDKRFKVYIGDDNSPENPIDLLEKYSDKFNFVYHKFKDNVGSLSLVKQWDRCIALAAEEEWIMILGDDDVLGDNVVEEFYKNLDKIKINNCNVVKFASQTEDLRSKTLSKIYRHLELENAASLFFNRYIGLERSSLSEHIFKREVYLSYGFKIYPLAWHSDDYAFLIFSEGRNIYCINNAVVKISLSSESISGDNNNLKLKNIAEFMFYKDITRDMLSLFTFHQRIKLLYQTELSTIKVRPLLKQEWKELFRLRLINFSLIPTLKFTRRYFKSLL